MAIKKSKRVQGRENGDVLNVEEAAERLRVSRNTAVKLLISGKLVGVKVGVQWRVLQTNVDKFLNPV